MPATAPTRQELFDPEFLADVSRFRILAQRVARGGVHAEQRSRQMGAGMEFRDYRGYAPGDDLRAIDWNIYRRLGRVFLRLFEEFDRQLHRSGYLAMGGQIVDASLVGQTAQTAAESFFLGRHGLDLTSDLLPPGPLCSRGTAFLVSPQDLAGQGQIGNGAAGGLVI